MWECLEEHLFWIKEHSFRPLAELQQPLSYQANRPVTLFLEQRPTASDKECFWLARGTFAIPEEHQLPAFPKYPPQVSLAVHVCIVKI